MTRTIKTFGLFLLIILVNNVFGQTTFNYNADFKNILEKSKDTSNNLSYDKLLKRFTANDTTLLDYEVLALLIGFTNRPEFKPYDDLDIEREIYKLNGEKKNKEALEKGLEFIKTHPLSVKTLYEIAYSYHKLNNEAMAKIYLYRGQRIFKAMYFSGNGKSQETPTFSLGPADGQDYIYKFVGADIGTMGSGHDKNGNFLDILDAKFEDGTVVTLYFIIQHATDKMFGGKSLKDELEDLKKSDKKK